MASRESILEEMIAQHFLLDLKFVNITVLTSQISCMNPLYPAD